MNNCTDMPHPLLRFEDDDKYYCGSSVTCIPHLPSPNSPPSENPSHQGNDDRPGRPVYPSPPPPPPPSPSRSRSFSSNNRKPRSENPRSLPRPDNSLQCDCPEGLQHPRLPHPPRNPDLCTDPRRPSGPARRWNDGILPDSALEPIDREPIYPPPPPRPDDSLQCNGLDGVLEPIDREPVYPPPPPRPDDSLQCDSPECFQYPRLPHPPRNPDPCTDPRRPSGPTRRWCESVLPDDDLHRLLIRFANPDPRPDDPSREPGPKRRWCHDTPRLHFTDHLPSFAACA